MPIYEYRCESCGHELEAMQKMSDAPLSDCPACERPELKKLISAAGFRLKGGGWYETDFKGDGRKNVHESAQKETKSAAPCGGAGGSGCD
jgi:putative FmdB family regulatory protein